jgi:hypothetical protein
MPGSAIHGKAVSYLALKFYSEKFPVGALLDVGAGSGTYIDLLKPCLSQTKFYASEVFVQNITHFGLAQRYDAVFAGDIRYIDVGVLPKFDVAVFGDIFEHMEAEQAADVLRRCLLHSSAAVISIPVGYHPQDEFDGNPFERHVKEDWSLAEMQQTFPDVAAVYQDAYIGVAFCGRTLAARRALRECVQRAIQIFEAHRAAFRAIEDFDYPKLIALLATL